MIDRDLPMDEYLKFQAIGSSEMRMLARGQTPAHVLARRNEPRKQTRSMILGAALHAIISGESSLIHVMEHDGRSKLGREERKAKSGAEFLGAVVCPADVYKEAKLMAESLLRSQFFREFVEHAQFEVTAIWEQDGLRFKSRLDIWDERQGVVGEIKTSFDDISPRGFGRTIGRERYDIQAWHHAQGLASSGLGLPGVCFIAVENKPPYLPAFYFMHPDVMERARQDWELCREEFNAVKSWGEFPGYHDGPITLTKEQIPVYYP